MKQNLIVIGRSDGSILIQDALQSLQQSTLQRSTIDQSNSVYSTQESALKCHREKNIPDKVGCAFRMVVVSILRTIGETQLDLESVGFEWFQSTLKK